MYVSTISSPLQLILKPWNEHLFLNCAGHLRANVLKINWLWQLSAELSTCRVQLHLTSHARRLLLTVEIPEADILWSWQVERSEITASGIIFALHAPPRTALPANEWHSVPSTLAGQDALQTSGACLRSQVGARLDVIGGE